MNLGLIGILLALAIPAPCTEALIEDDLVYEASPSKSTARTALRRSPAPGPPPAAAPLTRRIPDVNPAPARRTGIDWNPRLLSRPPPL